MVFIAADNKESNRNAEVVREARLIGRGYRIPGARSFTRELVSISLFLPLFLPPFSSFPRAAFTSVPTIAVPGEPGKRVPDALVSLRTDSSTRKADRLGESNNRATSRKRLDHHGNNMKDMIYFTI